MRTDAFMTLMMLGVFVVAGCSVSPAKTASHDAATSPDRAAGCSGAAAMPRAVTSTACTGFGRAYTREDIERTGATTTGDALALLDPSISVRR